MNEKRRKLVIVALSAVVLMGGVSAMDVHFHSSVRRFQKTGWLLVHPHATTTDEN